jgi:hypothetical protein
MKTVKDKIIEIFFEQISCHPSREDEIKFRDAIILLAEEIDLLRFTNEYDLESLRKQLEK